MNMTRRSSWRVLAAVAAVSGCGIALGGPPLPADDDEVAALMARVGEAEDYDGVALAYVLDEADVFVQDSGLATTKSRQIIKILTDKGTRLQSMLRFEFDPDTYRSTIESVQVRRKDGTVEDVPVASVTTQPSKQSLIFWGGKQHLLELPRLEIGDFLDIRTSKIGFNIAYLSNSPSGTTSSGTADEGEGLIPPMLGHWYEVTLFQGSYPILRKRYSVHMPSDKPVQYEVYNGSLKSSLWFDGDDHVYTFEADDIPPVKREPHMVALDDCATKLVMATLGTWEEKSRWFDEVNDGQFDADDAIRAEVARITEGLTTDEEKIAACTHWVADNIRYYGTKQGGACEGYTLHDSRMTYRDRGGVCKDKAGMLITMLRVLGHESYPALTMAGSRVEDIPADQFNHTVTVMREKDGSFRILDPTWVPLNRDLWSSLEQLQGLVYGTPEGESLTLSPYYTPEYNRRRVRATGEIHEDGTLSTKLVFDLDGVACNRFRRKVHGIPVPKRRAAFEEALHIAPNAHVENIAYTDPYDYSRDTHVEFDVFASGYAAAGDDVLAFRLPLMAHPLNGFFRASFLDRLKKEERKYAMRFWATRMIRYDETITLPKGWEVTEVPKPRSLDSDSVSLTFKATPGDGTLTYHFEFALKKGVVPAKDYPDYKKAIDMMYEISKDWIVCAPKPPGGNLAERSDTGAAKEVTR